MEKWHANGGKLAAEVTPPPDLDSPAVVPRHRVLKPEFVLHSRAFMVTYNDKLLQPAMWGRFREFVRSLKDKTGARAWAANFEQSLHAADSTAPQYHCHGYFIWTDGVGIWRRSLEEFEFASIRPRVDVCEVRGVKPTAPHSAACHGLWYVSTRKTGTLFVDTNYAAGPWYKASPRWLQGLLQDGKVTVERFVELSAANFPDGHAARKRDVDEMVRDRKYFAVTALVKRELKELEETDALREIDLALFPDLAAYVESFRGAKRRRRLVLFLGPSGVGKSLLAGQLLKKVGDILGLDDFEEITIEEDGYMSTRKPAPCWMESAMWLC